MRTIICLILGMLPSSALLLPAQADDKEPAWRELTPVDSFAAWRGKQGKWEVVSDATLNPENPKRLVSKPGKGVICNGPGGSAADLLSTDSFGDIELHREFLVAKRSNSGVKFHGHYEIQIEDSHGVKALTGSHLGGVYPRAELKPSYHHIDKGIAPRVNAAKPAGEWQSFDAIFLAPQFDAAGKKTANARLLKVVINGQTVHDNQELKTPTGHLWVSPEKAVGPILLQGDHGPVAFRNIKVRAYRR